MKLIFFLLIHLNIINSTFLKNSQKIYQPDGKNYKLGYISMQVYRNWVLDLPPLQEIIDINPNECSVACIFLDRCISINVFIFPSRKIVCQLLVGDKFRNVSSFRDSDNATHYAIRVSDVQIIAIY